MEEVDREVLGVFENNILAGRQVWILEVYKNPAATCTLMKRPKNQLELSKMAVDSKYRGMGLGKVLLLRIIPEAQKSGAGLLYLWSTRKLVPDLDPYTKAMGLRLNP